MFRIIILKYLEMFVFCVLAFMFHLQYGNDVFSTIVFTKCHNFYQIVTMNSYIWRFWWIICYNVKGSVNNGKKISITILMFRKIILKYFEMLMFRMFHLKYGSVVLSTIVFTNCHNSVKLLQWTVIFGDFGELYVIM